MELIYLYIDKFGDNIRKQGINFSPNFNVRIENNRLIVDDLREKSKGKFQKKIYPENIENITLLLGKNGAGKTTILKLLGMNREDRCDLSIKGDFIRDRYFLLYHINDNKYALELLWNTDFRSLKMAIPDFIRDIENILIKNNKNIFYKIPIGVVLEKKGEYFNVIEDLYKLWSDNIIFSYILDKDSEIIKKRKNLLNITDIGNYNYLYKRNYVIESQKWILYKYLSKIIGNSALKFFSTKTFIEVDISLDYNTSVYEKKLKEKLEKWIDDIEEKLDVYDEPLFERVGNKNIEINNIKDSTDKEIFLNDIISRYILNMFEVAICREVKDKDFENSKGKRLENIDYKGFLDKFKNEENKQLDSTELIGDIVNLEIEYENLLKVINYFNHKKISKYNQLIYVSRYLYSRIHKSINNSGAISEYQSSMEEMFERIRNLDEKYFYKNSLKIECTNNIDEDVKNFLKTYDKYKLYEYDDSGRGSDVGWRFKFNISNLSEGEEKLVELLSKIFDIIESSEDNKLNIILLDEPDQSLHPEWSRQFIGFICRGIKDFKNKNIQFVFSTHSPFMVSDILSENIYYLDNKISENRNEITITKMSEKNNLYNNSFGANIYNILKDNFILEKTIGQYAYEKISEFIKDIQSDNTLDDEYVDFFINSIGEEFLRKKLKDIYRRKRNDEKTNLINKINLLNDEEKLSKIKEILNGGKND
ncbi:ATP-binding protein [Clostridium perfringens]|uniref:AAA family ATPase n=1 Tax=Clostridium perfringens TaxID=1502 RepID=UPI0018E4D83F|nr:AAA family ATPase [Clostridium perfringens]MBI6082770.1 ATP-binding protein [Clostridium perfringens]MDK0648353.1 AAA family ATPase [Clostridium perfringens]MDM0884944.1 AAA family ATPase [Clostridium perfringens]